MDTVFLLILAEEKYKFQVSRKKENNLEGLDLLLVQ
jgi:hypothetical protein